MVRNLSESPVKGRRRSPPARHGSPDSGSPSPRTRRIRRAKEGRELERSYSRGSDRGSSPKRGRLLASVSRSPSPRSRRIRRAKEDGEIERSYSRGSSPKGRASVSRSSSPRSRRLRRGQEERGGARNYSRGSEQGERERKSSEKRSLKAAVLDSPDSQSPSPRSRRLRRPQDEKVANRECDRSSGRGSLNHRHKESNRDGEFERVRKERRSGRDEIDDRIRQQRSASPSNGHRKSRHRSDSPQPNHLHDEGPGSSGPEQRNDDDSLAKMEATEEALQAKEKHKPSFELSGKLAAETNRFRGVTLLFNEPPDARKPTVRWRLYVFKGGEVLNEPLYIHRQTCYLFGRERRVADIPTDHPSCSKQHAVIQYRQVEVEKPDGTLAKQVKPYLMDLGSTNKTLLNDNPIEPQRYYELFEKDTIKFGNSSREYVLLHENSVQ